jgi:hypothetical protein
MGDSGKEALEQDQHAPEFVEWLTAMDDELNQFLTADAPEVGALEDQWAAQALQLVELRVMADFGDMKTLLSQENYAIMDRYRRFVGEVFRRSCDGEWVNVASHHNGALWPVVLRPYSRVYLDPRNIVASAFSKKKMAPSQMSWVFNNTVDDYVNWKAAGKPTPEEYSQIVLDRMVEQAEGSDH